MDKINEYHLNKAAYIYIRQSTLQQVQHNLESQRIQYGLINRAKELGWQTIEVIDDDLGKSGTGKVKRPGFEKLLSEICLGNVGAVFAMDASRLARNGREWHTLLELCALVKTILIDLETIYDPCQVNDRLLLGMKGTLSEMEISLFRQRSEYAIRQKAQRGELYTIVAIGYLLIDHRLEKDPDKRIQAVISLVFKKFRQFASARQVLLWFREEKIELPTVKYEMGKRIIKWKLPVYNTILKILTNPVYAGSYAFGKTLTEVKIKNGIKKLAKGKRLEREKWSVLIHDHHEGYITWSEYEENQTLIKDNANMKGAMVRGSVKLGTALLVGLIRCGHCARKMLVHYNDSRAIRYHCKGAMINHGTTSCISFGGLRIDEAVSNIVLEIISPLGIEAALQAADEFEKKNDEIKRQRELALEEARFESERIRRQYNAVEPENRLVASELEKRWNQALEKANNLERELLANTNVSISLNKKDKDSLLSLGEDIKKVWFSEAATIDIKKRIIRILLKEIIAKVEKDKIHLTMHWQGGDHTQLAIFKNKLGQHRWVTEVETKHLIETLARYMPDDKIASLLTRLGKRTAKGHTWSKSRVCVFRSDHNIPIYQINEHRIRNELFVSEVSQRLNVSSQFIIRLIKKKILPAKQACKGAPWILEEKNVNHFIKQSEISGIKLAQSINSKQYCFDFSTT
jgi:DNA invertase Pin-like site-specific DNA recombinase